MAKNKGTVYLGYEDEEITAKHTQVLNSTTNKVGGFPDWPGSDIKVPNCSICSTARSLIVQIYAPLEQSQFHRTLYIFACLNPTCSQNSKSWLCMRTQHLDTTSNQCDQLINSAAVASKGKKATTARQQSTTPKISWCNGSDDWGDYEGIAVEEMDTAADSDNQQEENGNLIEKNDNSPIRLLGAAAVGIAGSEEEDDDEDESISMENEIICGLGQLEVQSAQRTNPEDPNANCAAIIAASAAGGGGSAVAGAVATATFCAEIEGDESDLVLVESPKKPERDLIALLKHTPNTAGIGPLTKVTDVTLKPFFIAVDVESKQHVEYERYGCALSDDHIRDMYHEYKRQDETAISPSGGGGGGGGNGAGEEHEVYEKALPAHGDIIFHQFITTIQKNPGQILRYSRDTLPLLNAPLSEAVPKCPNCNGDTLCELQILPTLIPKLRLQQNNEMAPIEFGNVLAFTCLKSCWDTPDKMRYERIIVQAEN